MVHFVGKVMKNRPDKEDSDPESGTKPDIVVPQRSNDCGKGQRRNSQLLIKMVDTDQ